MFFSETKIGVFLMNKVDFCVAFLFYIVFSVIFSAKQHAFFKKRGMPNFAAESAPFPTDLICVYQVALRTQ